MPYVVVFSGNAGQQNQLGDTEESQAEKASVGKRKTQFRKLYIYKYIHVYLLWRSYLQHVSVLSHEVSSLSIFIQSAIFCAVPLYNFSVFFPPFQSFPLPVLFHLVPHCGAKLINASKMLQQRKGRVCLLNACNTFLLFAGQSIFHPIYCVSIRLFQSSGYLGDFAF